ncbi:hypothetical protein Tco_0648070 [Tanacetum coccineum]
MEGKKKVNPPVIPGVRFTKLIINHLQSKHKFHKRPGSPLHLPYEESALGYQKFSFKNTKRVRFRMAIPDTLIFENIRSATYYPEYVAKVAKYQRYLAGEVLVDEFVDEDVPVDEPRFGDEESDMRKVVEESLKDAYVAPQGPLPPVVIREPELRKYKPLPEVQGKGKEKVSEEQVAQAESDLGKQVEDQARSDPGKQVEGQARSDPGVATDSQIQPSHVIHAGPNLEHMNLEEPASSARTLSSMQNLDKELSFTNQFLAEKLLEDELKKTNTEVEGQSMVTVPIHQDTSSFLLMTSPIIDLTISQPASTMVQASIPTSTATVTTQDLSGMIKDHIIEYMRKQEVDRKINKTVKEEVTALVQYAMRAPLRARFKDLLTSDMKEILLQRMLEENYDKGHEDHKMAYEALQKSILCDERASGIIRASDSAQDPLPPPSSITTNQGDPSQGSHAPGSSKTVASTTYTAWTTTTSRFEPSASSIPEDVFMHEESDSIPSSSLPVPINNWASVIASSYTPPPKNSLLLQTGPAYEVVKAFHPDVIHLQFQMEECHKLLTNQVDDGLLRHNVSRPLPLGGPTGQVTIQTEFFFNKDLEYLHFGNKGDRLALSITKIKAAHYPDAGTHMRILSVVRIEVFSIYGYDYMKKIILQRAHNQEYTITENDFKDLYPSDFEDLYLLNLQGHLNHLPPRDKNILSTAVNLWIRNLEATGLEFMHDYKILDSPRLILFRDKYGMQILIRFNEIHKFSDGTLQQIDEALDYRVKEFKVNKNNSRLNTSSRESSGTWKALLVEEYEKETTDFYRELNDDIFSVASSTSCVRLNSEDGNPARANIKQALGLPKDGDADTSFQQSQVHSHMLILKAQ